MSRLRALHIPFVQGVDDRVDAKLLPDGVLADVRNGRLRAAGSLALRRGWRPVSLQTIRENGTDLHTPDRAVDLYSTSNGLVALVENDGFLELQTFTRHSTETPWVVRASQHISPVTRVQEVGRMPDCPDDVTTVSCAVTADGVWGATLQQTATAGILRVYRIATDETRFFRDVGTNVAKVISLGSTFGLVDNTGSALRLRAFDPASTSGAFGSAVTLATVAAEHFDTATAVETTPTRIHLVYTDGGEVTYRQFTTAGVEQGTGKTVAASGAQGAWVASDDSTVHVVYQDTSDEVSLLSFTAAAGFATAAGPTALNAGTGYDDGYVAVGYTPHSTPARVWVAGGDASGIDTIRLTAASHTNISINRLDSCRLTGGWVTRGGYAGIGLVRGPAGARDAFYTDRDAPWFVQTYALASDPPTSVEWPWAPGQSPSGVVVAAWPRRSDLTAAQSRASGQIATRQAGVNAFRVFDTASRRPGAEFAGALYVAGGMLTQYVAGAATENGFMRPVIGSVVPSEGSGTLANGTYTYRAVVVWTDSAGRVHRSPVSDPSDITTTGANDTNTATVFVARTLRRDADLTLAPTVELYRTEAGPGELFYHVASAVMTNSDDEVTLTDTLPDSSIIDNKRLYTEGEFGEVSGALDVAPPMPSAHVAVLRDRVVVASGGPDYQVSQTALPEEPVCFTQPGVSGPIALAYQDSVEGDITGLATLDDTIVAGTASRVYVAGGEGPNLAGVGEFQSPARLPTDVGFYSADSIIEDADGLWFLGDADKLYVLPRGQGVPAFAGEAVQNRFGAAVVGAGRDAEDGVTGWAVADGTMVLRHSPGGQWLGDALPFDPVALTAHRGRFYAVDDDGGVWAQEDSAYGDGTAGATAVAMRVTTGDVQVYGLSGWGRLAGVELLGEFRTAAALLAEISYDMGLTWTSLGTHTVTGLSAGQAFQRQWHPARQRGGKFRLRFTMTPASTTAEGCRLTGFTVYFDQRSGPTRLDSAKRR